MNAKFNRVSNSFEVCYLNETYCFTSDSEAQRFIESRADMRDYQEIFDDNYKIYSDLYRVEANIYNETDCALSNRARDILSQITNLLVQYHQICEERQ